MGERRRVLRGRADVLGNDIDQFDFVAVGLLWGKVFGSRGKTRGPLRTVSNEPTERSERMSHDRHTVLRILGRRMPGTQTIATAAAAAGNPAPLLSLDAYERESRNEEDRSTRPATWTA
jgi:hypothetical protein